MRYDKGGEAITQIIQIAAEHNRYGPFDGFAGLKQAFWKKFNKEQRADVKILDTRTIELPECTRDCGLRRKCRFFQDVGNQTDWYDRPYFGVRDQKHRIVHTHNECPRPQREYHPGSPFGVLLRLYLDSIRHYPYCQSTTTS